MSLDELKPGRELDALVAEKVMGLQVETDPLKYFSGAAVAEHVEHFGKYRRVESISGGADIPLFWKLPHYSTDISAAWEVVEWFRKNKKALGFSFDVHWLDPDWRIENYDTGYSGYLYRGWKEGQEFDVQSSTFPHAICLAALKAVGYG